MKTREVYGLIITFYLFLSIFGFIIYDMMIGIDIWGDQKSSTEKTREGTHLLQNKKELRQYGTLVESKVIRRKRSKRFLGCTVQQVSAVGWLLWLVLAAACGVVGWRNSTCA